MRPIKQKSSSSAVIMKSAPSEHESERRLSPVIDMLLSQNPKQALRHIQQALNKRPGWPAARALRALALLQSARPQEASAEYDSLANDLNAHLVPLDEDAAKKMAMYLVEIERSVEAGVWYEMVWKIMCEAETVNFSLGEAAYCLYIRGKDFSKAQMIAMKMNRVLQGRGRFAMMACVALWLKLEMENGSEKDQRMAKLVCAMLDKAVEKGLFEADAVRFAVRVYKEFGLSDKVSQVLSKRRVAMDEGEVLKLRVPGSGAPIYRQLIEKIDPDSWDYWVKYFNAIQGTEGWEKDAEDLLDKIINNTPTKRLLRGPFLAQLELNFRLNRMEDVANGIAKYFELFGKKNVCAHDLRPYIALLADTEWFSKAIDGMTEIAQENEETHMVTFSWIKLWCDKQVESIESLYNRFEKAIPESNAVASRHAGDDYLILAAHQLLPDVKSASEDRYSNGPNVMKAIALLEIGLAHSVDNFRFKLLLMSLYIRVGAIGCAVNLWKSLDIKHVQLSTMSHLILNPLFDSGHHEAFRDFLGQIERLWRECSHDIPSCVSRAFERGSINTAVDFVLFRDRVTNSAVLAEAFVSEALHEVVITNGNSLGVRRAIECLTILPRFTPHKILEGTSLEVNDDLDPYQFWNITDYDPESRMASIREDDSSRGKRCPSLRTNVIAADLASLQRILSLAIPESDALHGNVDVKAMDKLLNGFLNCTGDVQLPRSTDLRVKIALNLGSVQSLLFEVTAPQESNDNGQEIHPEDVLSRAKQIANEIVITVQEMLGTETQTKNGVADCENGEETTNGKSISAEFSPPHLRKCYRFVSDTVLLTGTALLPFGPMLAKGKKRLKKAAKSTASCSTLTEKLNTVQDAVVLYREAVVKASSLIETWITSCLEEDLKWKGCTFDDDKSLAEVMGFLPKQILSPSLRSEDTDGVFELKKLLGSSGPKFISREDFLNGIIEQICEDHAQTCRSTLEVVSKTMSRMKMVDF